MSVFRIYSNKSNTIANNQYVNFNSGQNAVTDLWYGGEGGQNTISRFLINFALDPLINKFQSGAILSGNVSNYILKLKNAIPQDSTLTKDYSNVSTDKQIASSFDLIVFPVNKPWDQGNGYDLIQQQYIAVSQFGNTNNITGYSNWNNATLSTTWDDPGIYTNPTGSTAYSSFTQHFDLGNEDMSIDITPIVNAWLTGTIPNYGLGVAFRRDYELLSSQTVNVCSFFTQKTNSAFKPHLEVSYDQTIRDDRDQVTNNRTNRLFLYTFSGNNTANFFSSSTVTIKDNTGVSVLSGLTPNQLETGVYYVDVFLPNATKGQRYSDVWEGITFNPGYDVQNYTQYFRINDNYYLNSSPGINDYTLNTYGIEGNSILTNDQVIRVFAILRVDYSQRYPSPYYDIKYRMIMNNQEEVITWTSINKVIRNNGQENYFDLDTSWLLNNQTYKIEFRIEELGSIRILPESITFRIQKPF